MSYYYVDDRVFESLERIVDYYLEEFGDDCSDDRDFREWLKEYTDLDDSEIEDCVDVYVRQLR